jgi:K+-transporting ATPase ATPase A chain
MESFFYEWGLLTVFLSVLIFSVPFLGHYMAQVYSGQSTFFHPLLEWLERLSYRVCGVDLNEMSWQQYAKTLLIFNVIGFFALFLLQVTQGFLPLNPEHFPAPSWFLAFNTAASFSTNTNWQAYAGEATLSYLTQMLGLTVQNFLSASIGMCALLALIRGLTRNTRDKIGNFWVDLVRTVIYLLLPASILLSLLLAGEGVVQTLSPYVEVKTLENVKETIPLGPAASQIAIKQLGTNGGGFFNANSSHPFENPSAFSNFLEMFALILIPLSSVYMYGVMSENKKHAWLLIFVMFVFWLAGLGISVYSESLFNPAIGVYPVLEGKETRLGVFNSLLWSVSTTATSNGSVNNMLSSLSPLAGGVALFNIMIGEVIFGGIGVGLCSMIMFTLLTVFLAGLMVGRTPEYLGKKIEKREMQWVMLAVLLPGALILIGAGVSSVYPEALRSVANPGPHGLTEILYAFSSAAGNNGSSFAGLYAATPYYCLILGIVMLLGRLSIILPSLAIAGLLVKKKITPRSIGTFSTDTFLFATLLCSLILIVGALTFFPALSLGPLVEHGLMLQGKVYGK